MVTVGVVVFPGTNCERETRRAFASLPGVVVEEVWHGETELGDLDLVVLPGGFSYGDYLRPGAIARFSPVMPAVHAFAAAGGYVLGICNGFQILTEAGLLEGALVRNRTLRFISRTLPVRVEHTDTPWTRGLRVGEVLHLPVAHGAGNWTHHAADARRLAEAGRVLLRYCAPDGRLADVWNPNGSLDAVAGLLNAEGNVLGMMPHPERATEPWHDSRDGRRLLEGIVGWLADREVAA